LEFLSIVIVAVMAFIVGEISGEQTQMPIHKIENAMKACKNNKGLESISHYTFLCKDGLEGKLEGGDK